MAGWAINSPHHENRIKPAVMLFKFNANSISVRLERCQGDLADA